VYLQILRCGHVVILRDLTGLNVAKLSLKTTQSTTINTHVKKIRKLERQICVEDVDDYITLQILSIEKTGRCASVRRSTRLRAN
jgi:hypothetical protein